MKNIFTFLIASVFILNVATAQNVGKVAPDFSLKDLSDLDYKLSDNRGKVILVFLVGYNCTLCLASAPAVKSKILDEFDNNGNFQAIVIDVWDGSTSAFNNFKSSTNLNAKYLQNCSKVASGWSTTKDRLFVIDSEGKIAFKGTKAAQSDADAAKTAVQGALNNVATSVNLLDEMNGFALKQNYPNPVLGSTVIEFSVGKASDVNLSVIDIAGKKVLNPIQQHYSAGDYKVSIQVEKLKSGIYFYRFEADNFTSVKKMIIR